MFLNLNLTQLYRPIATAITYVSNKVQPNKASVGKILLLTPRDMHNTLCTIFSPTNFAGPRASLLLTTHLAYLYPKKKEKKIVSIRGGTARTGRATDGLVKGSTTQSLDYTVAQRQTLQSRIPPHDSWDVPQSEFATHMRNP